ncbi:NADH-quinone oxidoreductase subunit NuoK [Helicobacter saguini]|uniref:NADH-quinone oxidoreductase subunit K n=1 Tax=Helicobacter saguini TaxID=1548018 RepID=A0A347VSD0_9HELI|nr:NADH-quinone oxidoreductase subunit NuoK [Helicobacter saguini]MWV62556.1 NADH-quinone oxidoreductase subunit NuoK [Helicobacter saguini]MWV66770.1 NADH-quinone oxidoreductase subunit NuoK [Helicobacter saguini]MWV69121.1 NADH-quinone oxidoreductase subunit NuoK [Helicobacter saguini]MWV71324.1 NADH-quinone oxidoreductase subunit NuoK [Helicobacter saguini]TLD94166.1 NADH-quinone oxidoreductase subunit NuoK [Helicobacter saguini]
MVTLSHYLVFSAIMFCIGLYGILRRKNILLLLFSTEIMLNAINVAFVAIGYYRGDLSGQIIALFVIALAAAEVAIGLGLVILLHKKYKTLDLDSLNNMKG